MSVLVVGLSHRTAPLALLERAMLTPANASALVTQLRRSDHVAEAVVLVTCNRLEVYAEVSRFHGGVGEAGAALAHATGVPLADLTEHLYVHYEEAAVSHLFSVTCGLDSMAVGEVQILGQVRAALRTAQAEGSAGRALERLMQSALRVGKRAHAETRLDAAGASLVGAGLQRAVDELGPLSGVSVLVLGAGAMSGLVVASATRAGVGALTVASRTHTTAERLALQYGVGSAPIEDLHAALAGADLVIACTGAAGHVVDVSAARDAQRTRAERPQLYVDLALPRDVDPAVADLPGVAVADLEVLGRRLQAEGLSAELEEVRALVAAEVAGYLAATRAEAVSPTVVALRAMARSVVDAELARLETKLDGVDERVRAELEHTVHRVVEKLLHTPTVRIKELAAEPGGGTYAEALRALFGLGPEPLEGIDVPVVTPVAAPGAAVPAGEGLR